MKFQTLRSGIAPALALIAAMLSSPAQAQQPSANDAQRIHHLSLAATCANCHGTNGVSVAGDLIPTINQLSPNQLQEKLRGYKDGSLPGTIMPQLAKGYTDEQIQIIAQVLGHKNERKSP